MIKAPQEDPAQSDFAPKCLNPIQLQPYSLPATPNRMAYIGCKLEKGLGVGSKTSKRTPLFRPESIPEAQIVHNTKTRIANPFRTL